MQLVANGPDIPSALLQAHEEGRVVFFCGAGISYPAGLPGFRGLVDAIYQHVGTTRRSVEQAAYERDQFDATLDQLERRLPGQRKAVREALAKALQPKLGLPGATETHAALLQLARCRDGRLRLVTTNFDRLFAGLTTDPTSAVDAYAAPLLPVPKSSRWNGIVYLHGLLPENPDQSALDRLVLTSGDFGLAYLTERWASRFVSELFRNYVVCFVGYSISDPVLRYMMDALAADRILGETTPQAYAFGQCTPGHQREETDEWEAKGVAPILYDVPAGTHDHSALHRTLKVWAETYRDGILGAERIVVDYAMARPSASTQQDDFVGRMLWALSHESGLPAKRFADLDPVPSLGWLDALEDARFGHRDLARFGLSADSPADGSLRFSLISRPASYTRAPWITLVSNRAGESEWDAVIYHIARWLTRHLDDPRLILRMAQGGGRLHSRMMSLIEEALDRVADLERAGNTGELARLRGQAENAIPRPQLRILWRVMLAGRVKSRRFDLDIYRWKHLFERDGLTATLRVELRRALAPKVALKEPFRWGEIDAEPAAPKRLRQLVDWELVLAADHPRSALSGLAKTKHWRTAAPTLVDEIQQLLRDALDLRAELREADDDGDRSYWDLPSISPHWQNRGFRDWVALIELLRDAWQAVRDTDPDHATRLGQMWFAMPYTTFKRLALFAASTDGCITPDQWTEWLVSDEAWGLWSIETKRETLRLIVLQGHRLTPEARARVEAAIVGGPPRAMYRDDLEPKDWQDLVDDSVWLYLAKLQSSGGALGPDAAERLAVLSAAHPKRHLADNERDEFSHWMSGTGDPDFEDDRVVDVAPRTRGALVPWLKRPQPSEPAFSEDTWRETCRSRFYHCALALCDLAGEGQWPTGRWREALQVWSEEGPARRSWRFLAQLVKAMPDHVLKDVGQSMSWWLEAVSKGMDCHEEIYLGLCRRILDLSFGAMTTDQPVTRAINHPAGHVTQGLLNLWFKREPSDADGLPAELEPFFTRLSDTSVEQFRHGRVVLASRLIALFRVDRRWTELHLLPLFDWTHDAGEARAVWAGFLWSPRLYHPLLIALREAFLDTAHHYDELGGDAQQFSTFLTYAALQPPEGYTAADFQKALAALPQEGLDESARALGQALEGAGEQREDYAVNHILPFWHDVWPKDRRLASNSMAESLARLSITARGRFPEVLTAVVAWLRPIEHPYPIVHWLYESGLSGRFPEDALRLLDAVIDDQQWPAAELTQCLTAISQQAPPLLADPRYLRLFEYSRRRDA